MPLAFCNVVFYSYHVTFVYMDHHRLPSNPTSSVTALRNSSFWIFSNKPILWKYQLLIIIVEGSFQANIDTETLTLR
jgi:hypothetical protein